MSAIRLDKVVYLLFFISGACGLVYEVIWGKYLSLFIGNTTYAHMIVLATFMGGLAAGSFLFGRIADRVKRPLKMYAWLEIGIGLYGALYSPILEGSKELYFSMAIGMEIGGIGHALIKLPLAFFTLILPTCLMGGTLPVLSRFFIRSLGSVGQRVALLYFINSFGAVAGTLIAGFYVIEHQGLVLGLTNTGIINVVVGIMILILDLVMHRQPEAVEEAPETVEEAPVVYEDRLITIAMVGIFLSGFTSMIYELVWFRIFAVVLESSTYSFSLMLAAFITGITVGSLVAGRIMMRTKRLLFWFALCEFGIAATVLLAVPLYERLPYYFWQIRYLLRPIEDTFVFYNIMKFSLCFIIMLAPTLFFGMTLPLVSNIAGTSMGQMARKIGNVYAANTVGTLLGALMTGLVFIPAFGLAHSLEIAFVLNLLIAVVVLLNTTDLPSPLWRPGVPGVSVVLVLAYLILVPDWNNKSFALGVFRLRGAPPPTYTEFRNMPVHDYTLRYYKEDVSSNVAILEHPIGDDEVKVSLSVNGKVDATSEGDVPTQVLLGQLPLMLQPDPKDVLIVGLGSGMTAGTALTHPIDRLDCIEISEGVAAAIEWFAPYNHDVLNNPKFNLIVDDAKTYINTTEQKYDVIISEPSNPWMAGVGNLFSVEFFQDAKQVLNPGGIAVQWFHRYEINNDLVSSVVRTFQRVFPYTYIFQGNSADLIMVGSDRRITPDFTMMAEKFNNPDIARELEQIHVKDLASLLALQMISPEYIPKITSTGSLNSDYRPIIEYRAPLALYLGTTSQVVARLDERFTAGSRLLFSAYAAEQPLTSEQYKNLYRLFDAEETRNSELAYSILTRYIELEPEDNEMQRAFARLSIDKRNHSRVLEVYKPFEGDTNLGRLEAYANYLYFSQRPGYSVFNLVQFDEVRSLLERTLAVADDIGEVRIKLAQLDIETGRYRDALDHYLDIMRIEEANPDTSDVAADRVMALAGRALFELNDFENAQAFANKAFEMNKDNLVAAVHQVMIDQIARFQEIEREVGN